MKKYYRSLCILIAFLIIFEGVVIYYTDFLKRPYWGDETHFVETIHRFGEGITIDLLKHYNEMNAPLPFVMYSIWGRIFGFDIYILRIFSVIVALITYVLFHRIMFKLFDDSKIALPASVFLVINPYMIGFSVFVYTDMSGIMFLIISCLAIVNSRPLLFAISTSGALLCRQYLIFFPVAAATYFILKLLKAKDRASAGKMLVSCFISLLPLIFLISLWNGLSPDNVFRQQTPYVREGIYYHPESAVLYIIQMFVYLSPLILLFRKYFYNNYYVLAGCFIASWLYWLFPVVSSKLTMEAGIQTVGFFHRLLKSIFKEQLLIDGVFFLSFFLGLPLVYYFAKECYLRLRNGEADLRLLLDLLIILFLFVMPFSYQNWEKYFIPLVPFLLIRILMVRYS
ncbi:MAG: glycosyltransferase family 39 protein [Nitrospirae bacterium]|nr:glycosyltransferase family 39 protein [Nitrospirota bacterium]